jgi:hypothetical protein
MERPVTEGVPGGTVGARVAPRVAGRVPRARGRRPECGRAPAAAARNADALPRPLPGTRTRSRGRCPACGSAYPVARALGPARAGGGRGTLAARGAPWRRRWSRWARVGCFWGWRFPAHCNVPCTASPRRGHGGRLSHLRVSAQECGKTRAKGVNSRRSDGKVGSGVEKWDKVGYGGAGKRPEWRGSSHSATPVSNLRGDNELWRFGATSSTRWTRRTG